MKKCKLAVIGYGGMGNWHCNGIREKVSEIEIQGIFDIREEAKQQAIKDGLNVYESFEELLADKEIDFVTIATPNDYHKDYAIKCMRAGLNVVSEKPVTLNAGELEDIIAVSKETGKLFTIHQNRRWDKDYKIIKKLYDEDTLGKPYFIESRVQGSRQVLHGWRGKFKHGGGMLLDWGVHLIDQLMMMIDSPVVGVSAHLVGIFSEEVDDNLKVVLSFENNISAVVEISTNCLINHPRWHMSCTDGTVVVDNFKCEGKMVQVKKDGSEMDWEDVIVYTEAGPTRTMAPRPKYTTKEVDLPTVKSDWADFYKNIVATIAGTEELIVKPEEALRVMKVIDLAFKASEQKCGISCRI